MKEIEQINQLEALLKILRGERDIELSLKNINLRQVGYLEGQISIMEMVLKRLREGINKNEM